MSGSFTAQRPVRVDSGVKRSLFAACRATLRHGAIVANAVLATERSNGCELPLGAVTADHRSATFFRRGHVRSDRLALLKMGGAPSVRNRRVVSQTRVPLADLILFCLSVTQVFAILELAKRDRRFG